jgi:hemerythrin-like domain-containing protein
MDTEGSRSMTAEPSAAIPPEQLNGFLLVHATLRKGGADLATATARFGETTLDPSVLIRLWAFYARGLRQHHHGEDRVVFPLVVSRRPDFADAEADLVREHHGVDELIDAVDAAFTALGSSRRAADAKRAAGVLAELNDALGAHLQHEETVALPVIAATIPPAEMEKIEKGLLREIPRSDLGLSLAALDATTKAHPELHLPPVPKLALVLLALVWRRQYTRLVAAAGV